MEGRHLLFQDDIALLADWLERKTQQISNQGPEGLMEEKIEDKYGLGQNYEI